MLPQQSSLLDEPLPTFLIRVRPHHFFAPHCMENIEAIQVESLHSPGRFQSP